MESEGEVDPDLIPLNGGVCAPDWDSPGRLQFYGANVESSGVDSEGGASTLLPPDSYAYPTAPLSTVSLLN